MGTEGGCEEKEKGKGRGKEDGERCVCESVQDTPVLRYRYDLRPLAFPFPHWLFGFWGISIGSGLVMSTCIMDGFCKMGRT